MVPRCGKLFGLAHPGMQSDIELREGAFALVFDAAGQSGGDRFSELGFLFVGEEPDPPQRLFRATDQPGRVSVDLAGPHAFAEHRAQGGFEPVLCSSGPLAPLGHLVDPVLQLSCGDRFSAAIAELVESQVHPLLEVLRRAVMLFGELDRVRHQFREFGAAPGGGRKENAQPNRSRALPVDSDGR